MALSRIVLVTHTHDNFRNRNSLLKSLSRHWADSGHAVILVEGLGDWPDGDLAIMHVDLSLIPAAYSDASKRYPLVVNGAATDIRKRRVSRNLVNPGDGWTGPVIIKTDLNYGGIPEWNALQQSKGEGTTADLPSGPIISTDRPYPILRSSSEVPMDVWSNAGLVVERFLPEQDTHGFWTRAWVFCGDRERCTRYLSKEPIVKTSGILARESVPVPDELRAERERLGFDYGKFDFVVRDGKAILLDANRTPSAPPSNPDIEASNANLARGLAALLRKPA
jgi:hypothetical protein